MGPRAPSIAVKRDEDPDYDEYVIEEEEEDELDSDDGPKLKRKHALPEYSTQPRTMRDLHDMIHEGLVDLDAEYQREVVWADSKQIMLIDSIMNNFYIPPVVFSVKQERDPETGEDTEIRVCTDGKQRLTSMQRFMDGFIPYKQDKVNFYYELPHSSKTKRNRPLDPQSKKQFANKMFICVEYYDITDTDERAIFNRVQMGMALSPAEKLNSVHTEWTKLVRAFLHQFIASENGLGSAIKWGQRRGVDFSCVAQILFCLHNYPSFALPTLQPVEKFLRTELPPSNDFQAECRAIFTEYVAIAEDPRYNSGFREIGDRVAPAEMVMIGLLLRHMKECTLEQKADQITRLRIETRRQHKDVRMNDRVTKTMWEYILNIDCVPAAPRALIPSSVGTGSKRRKHLERREDEEYRPVPGRLGN